MEIGENPEWITAIATSVSTGLYMIFTGWIIYEEKKTRKLQEQPHVDVYIERAPDYGSKIELIIENNGLSGAYDIKLECDSEFKCFSNSDSSKHNNIKNWGPFTNGIPFLPARGKRNYTLTMMTDNFEEKVKTTLNISIKYRDKYGEKHSKVFPIRFNEFENTLLPIEEPQFKTAKHLEAISKDLRNITSGWSKIFTITQSKEEYDNARKKQIEG